jgi:hypothetical protein
VPFGLCVAASVLLFVLNGYVACFFGVLLVFSSVGILDIKDRIFVDKNKQDRQYTIHLTYKRVRTAIVAIEKQ